MTQSHQRNLARHMLLARAKGDGNGTGTGTGNGGGDNAPLAPPHLSLPTNTDLSTSAAPSSPVPTPPAPPPPQSSDPQPPSSSAPIVSTASSPPPPPPVVKSTTSATSPALTSTSKSFSSTTITPSSTILPTSSAVNPTIAPVNPIEDTNPLTIVPTSSFNSSPALASIGTTVSATPTAAVASGLSAGSIVGAVAGTLVGLALLGFLVAFILRRYRQSRRRALRDSDFGTSFRRSAFATPQSATATLTTPDMAETDHHNVGPSLNEPYNLYPAATAQPPSKALAAATATVAATTVASGGLHERPKYVYGQDPRQHDDVATDVANGGAYSSQPQVQSAYNAEAYGSYAKYEDVSNGIVGGVPGGSAMYQDAQRAYQGQQGYDQIQYGTYDPSHFATYDQSQYAGYGQQQQEYVVHDQQQQHHQAYAT